MKKKVLALLAAAALAITLLAGCAGQTFDASGYVEATLQYLKTGSTTDRDALAKYTDSSAEELEAEYDEIFSSIPDMLDEEMESAGVTLTDEASSRLESLLSSLFSTMSFTVGEATENDDGSFDVPVDINPVQFTVDIEQLQEEYLYNMDYTPYADMSDEELTNAITSEVIIAICDELDAQLESPTYGDAISFTLHIEKNADGIYEPDNDTLTEIGEAVSQGLSDVLS